MKDERKRLDRAEGESKRSNPRGTRKGLVKICRELREGIEMIKHLHDPVDAAKI